MELTDSLIQFRILYSTLAIPHLYLAFSIVHSTFASLSAMRRPITYKLTSISLPVMTSKEFSNGMVKTLRMVADVSIISKKQSNEI